MILMGVSYDFDMVDPNQGSADTDVLAQEDGELLTQEDGSVILA